VLIGLSGGIDSALTAALAADALGPERVTGVAMPSAHSAPESLEGAQALAESLGIRLLTVPVAGVVGAFEDAVAEHFAGRPPGELLGLAVAVSLAVIVARIVWVFPATYLPRRIRRIRSRQRFPSTV